MRHNLSMICGGVLGRLQDPTSIGLEAVLIEVNNAYQEIYNKIRQSREDWQVRVSSTDLISGIDVYPYPPDCGTPTMIERMDATSTGSPIFDMQRVSYYATNQYDLAQLTSFVVANSMVILPGRQIRIIPTPSTNTENGIRWTYHPLPSNMCNMQDEPELPAEIQEALIPATIDRIRQFRNVQLANDMAYNQWRAEQMLNLERFLRPKDLIRPNSIIDEDEYYT